MINTGDWHEARMLVAPLVGVGTLHRPLETVRVVEEIAAQVTLGTQLAVGDGIVACAVDGVDAPVGGVDIDATARRALGEDVLGDRGLATCRLRASLPEQGICSDDELVSISLIDPAEVRQVVDRLVSLGLSFDWEGNLEDIAFADQKRGLITPCDWLTFETVNIGIGGTPPSVAICRLAHSQSHELRVPDGWSYQGSFSEAFGAEGTGRA